ncbi:hypothetical protein SAMN04490202_5155 [Pseudomonas reinekei]|uniref:Uncharacterized protein n=1 Tax=Pseudomonas reinekei TaxID=395598 RepID=A0A1H0U5V1_PSERE|nr:hypothetical protein [Pseudomonas reinekei]KAB0488023.1 hypothetical protein F7R15_04075 [Pseudomonas reinekei]OLU05459.1 hypothetical protein BVK86_04070 [Pseudomonas reinekei]SDP61365.1 hypothetical protein SAMN04490202_5155 [Pseudomonas reinekei]
MLNTSIACYQPTTPFKIIQVQTAQGNKQLIHDDKNKLTYLVQKTQNTEKPGLQLHNLSNSELHDLNIQFINKIIQCNPAEMLKEPGVVRTFLAQYSNSTSIPNRFRAITDLNEVEKTQYKQISEIPSTDALRCKLVSLIDEDLREPFHSILNEWSKFGVSVSEIDVSTFENFKAFYDEVMSDHATQKEDYTKLDFATQNIKPLITDSRCLEAKLTPFQIFKAAYQLGDIPAVSNFRFMDNPASKDDGKYREWMFHFDNSNYAAEFKLITTRVKGTAQANKEQCLAAFPYDTTASIRYTQSEAATKFPNLQDLETEFRGVPGASYVVIQNPDNDTPLETGIRTEMIVHHRSASSKDGQDQGESRSSELMTFHGLDRCKPFLSGQALSQARNLTPLQTFVLGGFKTTSPEKFMECLTSEKEVLNSQVRALIEGSKFKPLENLTVATFEKDFTVVKNKPLFDKQMNTYENLPEVLEKVPSLADESAWQAETLFRMIPMLMNYDQNAELKPDCTENDAFPARTQLRERTNEAFFKPLERDLTQVKFGSEQDNLLPLEKITEVAQNVYNLYRTYTPLLKAVHPGNPFVSLFESRAALAKEYIEQFRSRATLPETHQTLTLFTYYMLDDLDAASQVFSENNIRIASATLDHAKEPKPQLLQHFITHRILSDRNNL